MTRPTAAPGKRAPRAARAHGRPILAAFLLPALVLALTLLLGLLQQVPQQPVPPPADTVSVVAQVADDAAPVADDLARMKVRPIVSVGSLYSSSRGIGVGGGFAASNVATRGDHVQVEGRVGQRVLGAFGSYMTGEPERAPLFGVLAASVVTSSRFPFQGTGPHSDPAGRLHLDRMEAEAEARVGWQPWGVGGTLVQPFARVRVDRLRGFEERSDSSLAFVTDRDLAAIARLTGDTRRIATVGLSGLTDTRDSQVIPTRGLYAQGSAARSLAIDGSGLGFNRAEILGYLFRPSPLRLPFQRDKGALFLRVSAIVTRQDAGDDLPLVYLPVYDRDRLVGWPARSFVGRDAFSVGLGARGALFHRPGVFRIEGFGVAALGAAYDDVFREFTPRVTLSDDPVPPGAGVALQPSLGVGVNIHYRDKERPLVGGLVGIGPAGVTLTGFRLVIGLERYRPDVR